MCRTRHISAVLRARARYSYTGYCRYSPRLHCGPAYHGQRSAVRCVDPTPSKTDPNIIRTCLYRTPSNETGEYGRRGEISLNKRAARLGFRCTTRKALYLTGAKRQCLRVCLLPVHGRREKTIFQLFGEHVYLVVSVLTRGTLYLLSNSTDDVLAYVLHVDETIFCI